MILDRLSLLTATQDLLAGIWYDIDVRGGQNVADCFVADGRLRIEGHTVRGRAEIDALYAKRRARGPRITRHRMSNLYAVDCQAEASTASATIYHCMTLYAQDGNQPGALTVPIMVADVLDELVVFEGGAILLRSRSLDGVFVAPDATFGIPTR
jgi:hypothetical protein